MRTSQSPHPPVLVKLEDERVDGQHAEEERRGKDEGGAVEQHRPDGSKHCGNAAGVVHVGRRVGAAATRPGAVERRGSKGGGGCCTLQAAAAPCWSREPRSLLLLLPLAQPLLLRERQQAAPPRRKAAGGDRLQPDSRPRQARHRAAAGAGRLQQLHIAFGVRGWGLRKRPPGFSGLFAERYARRWAQCASLGRRQWAIAPLAWRRTARSILSFAVSLSVI